MVTDSEIIFVNLKIPRELAVKLDIEIARLNTDAAKRGLGAPHNRTGTILEAIRQFVEAKKRS